MKYLLKNRKVGCSGSKKQLIEYVKENYSEEYWVREYGKLFDTDFGKFKFAIEAVYINDEYSPFKWLAWVRDNKIRLIHQDYGDYDVETVFDILVDKNCFYDACNRMISKMQKYADADKKRYEQYVKNKYGKKDK